MAETWLPMISTCPPSVLLPDSKIVDPSSGSIINFNKFTDEEGFKQLRLSLQSGIDWIRELSIRNASQHRISTKKMLEFDKLKDLVSTAHSEYEKLEASNRELALQVTDVKLSNEALTLANEELKQQLSEKVELSKKLKTKVHTLVADQTALNQVAHDMQQELDGLKASFSKKVADLELSCSEKDVLLKVVEEKLVVKEKEFAVLQDQCRQLTDLEESLRQEICELQLSKNDQLGEINWLLREGIPKSLRFVLQSGEFVSRSTTLQNACVEFGMDKGCPGMKERFPDQFADVTIAPVYPRSGLTVVSCYSEMINFEYSLLQSLKSGSVGISELKRLIGEDGTTSSSSKADSSKK